MIIFYILMRCVFLLRSRSLARVSRLSSVFCACVNKTTKEFEGGRVSPQSYTRTPVTGVVVTSVINLKRIPICWLFFCLHLKADTVEVFTVNNPFIDIAGCDVF